MKRFDIKITDGNEFTIIARDTNSALTIFLSAGWVPEDIEYVKEHDSRCG